VLALLEKDRKQNSQKHSIEFIVKLEEGHYDKIDLRVK
jgi:hypothetical protein